MLALLFTLALADEAPAVAPNPSCLVDGTWFSPDTERAVATTFSAGVFSTRTAEGHRVARYEVDGGTITFAGGSLGKVPRGEPVGCAPGTPGTYETVWTSDCWTLRLVAVDDPCAHRKAQVEAVTLSRAWR